MLPEELRWEIQKGPQSFAVLYGKEQPMHSKNTTLETHYAFATRIAELATRLEREACVKVLREKETASKAEWNEYLKTVKPYDPITNPNPAGATDYSFVWAVAAEAIEARGRKA